MQPGVDEFIFAIGQGGGAEVHGLGQRFIHEVDHKLVREPDVEGGILGGAVLAVAGRKGDDGGPRAEDIEKAEGRGVDPALRTEGGDQRNGAGRDEAGEDLVGAAGIPAFKIKFHGGKINAPLSAAQPAGEKSCWTGPVSGLAFSGEGCVFTPLIHRKSSGSAGGRLKLGVSGALGKR